MRDWLMSDGNGAGSEASDHAAGEPDTHHRRKSDADRAHIVSESHEPGASPSAVARRHGLRESTLRKWRRCAEAGDLPVAGVGGAVPPFVPLVVDGASPDRAVAIEALGVVVRLPEDSPVDRIVALALGLGRAS